MESKNSCQKDRVIRASYDRDSIIVYQAFSKEIAFTAVEAQTFVSPPFKMERMTWIKPSFLWTMYRSGWGTKEKQERILAIKIKREGFEWALRNSCLSHFTDSIYAEYGEWKNELKKSPVRVQWDPERDFLLKPLKIRSIQIGLRGVAVEKYVSEWIIKIEDITLKCQEIHNAIENDEFSQAKKELPTEREYIVSPDIASRINHSSLFRSNSFFA